MSLRGGRTHRTWFDDFPPDDQERLLGYFERFMALVKGRDRRLFLEWVDKLFVLIERLEEEFEQPSGRAKPGDLPTPPRDEA